MNPLFFKNLPYDLKELIFKFYCANIIQRYYRKYSFRHCNRKEWKELIKLLIDKTSYRNIDILNKELWVIREWKTEPGSWIYMLKHEPKCLTEILTEINNNQFKKVKSNF